VLQGEVEQISLMDAQQLLSYLSEIIGTHEYEELLTEQAKKCATLTC
jgi:chromosome segregation ATPase